jgi:NADH-quinone oxidoreductase subunit I
MPILQNIAAIAKGMSITFMEMFQPTTVENYPDGPGPLRGAAQEVFAARTFCSATRMAGEVRGLLPRRGELSGNCIYIEAAENTAEHRVSGAERYAKVYNIDYNRCILRILRRGLPDRRHHPRPRIRVGEL